MPSFKRYTEVYMKLIRDKVAAHLIQEGGHTVFSSHNDYEFTIFLNDKLDEEVNEFKAAPCKEDALQEAADVLEVLTTILALHGYTLKDLLEAKKCKLHENGGFENRYILDNKT